MTLKELNIMTKNRKEQKKLIHDITRVDVDLMEQGDDDDDDDQIKQLYNIT